MEGARPPDDSPGPPVSLRRLRFEEVAEALRMVQRAVEHGCRRHYDPRQRAAVTASYASHLFIETVASLETVVAEQDGRICGLAQLDPGEGRLRALFVDADRQGRGLGQVLLREIEERARRSGVHALFGAMALNAVPFYLRAGFGALTTVVSLTSSDVPIPVLPMEKKLFEAPRPRAR